MIEREAMSQREYEDRQSWLLEAIDKAQKALWLAEARHDGERAIRNRLDALYLAQEAYDRFMGPEVE